MRARVKNLITSIILMVLGVHKVHKVHKVLVCHANIADLQTWRTPHQVNLENL